MKTNTTMLLLGAVGAGALLFLGSTKSSASTGGAETPVTITAGKTYQVIMRAVGASISDQEVTDSIAILQALGTTVKSHSLNDSRDTLTVVMTAGRNGHVITNHFYPSPSNPNLGMIFTAVEEVPASA